MNLSPRTNELLFLLLAIVIGTLAAMGTLGFLALIEVGQWGLWPGIRDSVLDLFRRFQVSDHQFLIVVSVIIGVVVGLGTVVFVKLLEGSSWLFREFLPGLLGGRLWVVALVPALGGLCLAPFIRLFPKEATSDGVPSTMEAVALQNGFIRWTNGLLSMILSALTLDPEGQPGVKVRSYE